ncbi:MAG: ABC transporter permease [Planctomycetota bacterium]
MIGGLLMIVRRSLRQHALSTFVTVLSAALGSGLVMAVFVVAEQSERAFAGGPVGFDAVLGARGSQLQLVLNTVFHLETSPGNIPWSLYQEVKSDRRVDLAIPYAVGDNYRGYRIVGTTQEMFTEFEYQEGEKFELRPGGEIFEPLLADAVIGSTVAADLGLRVGSEIQPFHGLQFDESLQHNEVYRVVGVLKPTNSPSDRVVWIPIEGIFRMGGHVLRGTGEVYQAESGVAIPDEHKEVSAVMLKFKGGNSTGMYFDNLINRQGKVATLAWPIGSSMAELFDKLGWVNRILSMVAYLVVAVAAGSILASLYNTMNERRREFAILRALGARRSTVFSAIVLEAGTIAGLGALLGFAFYFAVLAAAAGIVREQTGVVIEQFAWHPVLLWTPLGMLLLGALAGCLPAYKAYATDVASNLLPAS